MTVTTGLIQVVRLLLTGDMRRLFGELARGVKKAYDLVASRRSRGMYEVLEHATTLDLMDSSGGVAVVKRRQKVRFLQDHVVAIADYAWGDGRIFAEYSCSPGTPVDMYSHGSRHTVLISLREAKSRGDALRFKIHRKIIGGFTGRNEWWETEIYHRTKRLKVDVIFPRDRQFRKASVTLRSTNRTTPLGPRNFRFLNDGRQKLTWEIAKPKLHDRYILKWVW